MNWTGIFPTIMGRFWLSDILRLVAQIQADLSPRFTFRQHPLRLEKLASRMCPATQRQNTGYAGTTL